MSKLDEAQAELERGKEAGIPLEKVVAHCRDMERRLVNRITDEAIECERLVGKVRHEVAELRKIVMVQARMMEMAMEAIVHLQQYSSGDEGWSLDYVIEEMGARASGKGNAISADGWLWDDLVAAAKRRLEQPTDDPEQEER